MGTPDAPRTGPELTLGIELSDLPDGGMLLDMVHDEAILLVRRGDQAGPKRLMASVGG